MADEVNDLPSTGSATAIWNMASYWFLILSSNETLARRYSNFQEIPFTNDPALSLPMPPAPPGIPDLLAHPLTNLTSSMMTSTFSLGQASVAVSEMEDVEMEDVSSGEPLDNPTVNAPQPLETTSSQRLSGAWVDLRHLIWTYINAYFIQVFVLRIFTTFQHHSILHRSIRLKLIRIYSVLLCLEFRGPWVSTSSATQLTEDGSFYLIAHAVFTGLKRIRPGVGRE